MSFGSVSTTSGSGSGSKADGGRLKDKRIQGSKIDKTYCIFDLVYRWYVKIVYVHACAMNTVPGSTAQCLLHSIKNTGMTGILQCAKNAGVELRNKATVGLVLIVRF